jgi:Fic family protein
MTLSDVEEVLFDNKVLMNRTAIEQTEARNHQTCLHWLLSELQENKNNLRIDSTLIQEIHLRLMNGLMSDAGKFRKHSVRIMGSRVSLTNWQKIPDAIERLFEDLADNKDDPIRTIAYTHAIFEKIHPFSDGNGRTGRLLTLVQALRAGIMPPIVLKEHRFAYYKYLEEAQTNENYLPLEKFIAETIINTAKLVR